MSIFTHITVGANDLNKARNFYDTVLGALGLKRIADLGENGSIWGEDAPPFFVLNPANGQPALVTALLLVLKHLAAPLSTHFMLQHCLPGLKTKAHREPEIGHLTPTPLMRAI
jgi:catechol 2,3-dioxygenase-like lactoylglutathione lyase family enzyme